MDKISVLLAEDETALAHIVRESLEERDFNVILCADGERAYQQYLKYKPDILALDVMMPKCDGFEVAKRVRENDITTPIIFLTARSQPKDVVAGFEIGANDYLKKPFSVEELIVRIRVLLSSNRLLSNHTNKNKSGNETFHIGDLVFNGVKNNIYHGLNCWPITSRESDILKLLCQYEQQVLPRDLLLKKIWGNNTFFNARSLDVFITKLRNHLKADPNVQIINIRGIGYKLVW